jgi:hypothetical protein
MSGFIKDSISFSGEVTSLPINITGSTLKNISRFSSWLSSNDKEKSYQYILNERKDILSSRIISFFVTTEPLSMANPAPGSFDAIRQILPSIFGGSKLCLHLSAYLLTEKGGVLIEYGKYQGQCVKNHFAHYYKEGIFTSSDINENGDGMHFYKLNPKDYFSEKLNLPKFDKEKFGKNYSKGYYCWGTLDLDENHRFKVEDLIEKLWDEDDWSKAAYNVFNHNCQDFVAKIIKLTNAKRLGKGYRKVHNISLVNFPFKIIDAFEINENESNTFGKIPIIGLLNDIYHWHIKKDISEEDDENIKITHEWMEKFGIFKKINS